jgi:prepilin-type processing-associated H-X9-DG protein
MTRTIPRLLTGICLALAAHVRSQEIPTFESATKTSYGQVTPYLNPGGDTYIYQNAAQWGETLEKALPAVRQIVTATVGRHDREETEIVLQIIGQFLKDSGLRSLNGIGASSIPLENGLHHNRVYIGHTPGQPEGLLWNALMQENTPLPLLKALPPDTVLATRIPLRGALVWKWFRKTVAGLDNAEARQEIEGGLSMLQREGLDLDTWLATLGDGASAVLTLAPKPEGEKVEGGPQAVFMDLLGRLSLAVLVEVKDDTVFTGLEALMQKENAPFIRQDDGDIRVLSLTERMPVPGFGVAFVQFGKYFGFVSNTQLAKTLHEGKGGLTETAAFKRVAAKLPQTGMGFSYLSPRLGDELSAAVEQAMQGERGGMHMAFMGMIMTSVSSQLKGQESYAVSIRTKDGALALNTATLSLAQAFIGKTLTGPSMAMMPVVGMRVEQAQGRARTVSDAGNLKQIGMALRMYAADFDETFPSDLGMLMEKEYLKTGRVYVAPGSSTQPPFTPAQLRGGRCDYLYFGAGMNERGNGNPSETPLACTKPGLLPNNMINVLYADGHVKGHVGIPAEVKALIGKARAKGAVVGKQDVNYARIRGMKFGQYIAKTSPKARILLIMPATPKGGTAEALLAGLKATLGEDANVVATVTLTPPPGATGDGWYTGRLLNEKTAKLADKVDLVVSGMGLPVQDTRQLWFWSKKVKVAIAAGDVSRLGRAIQAGLVVAATAMNPKVIPDDWQPPKELDAAFAKRFLLITPENLGAMIQEYPKLFKR